MKKKPTRKQKSSSSQSSDLADILFPTEDKLSFEESILNIPPEQRRLHTETIDYNVTTLVESMEHGDIQVPAFQRKYVWNNAQASRLIESLIIQCPIPVVYLSQRSDEILDVIDGNQRLNSLKRFLNDEFQMTGLTAYPELEGNYFSDLDPRFQRHITNRTVRCLIILKDTHPQVKFDVFERLNSGAVRLNAQELRHGIYHGDVIRLAEQAAKKHVFANMVAVKANKDRRMKLEELVLRFFAMDQHLGGYSKPLSGFINTYCENNRRLDDEMKSKLLERFDSTTEIVSNMFGDLAFSVFKADGAIISRFNAALYDSQMVGAAILMENPRWKIPSRQVARTKMLALLDDAVFVKRISKATSDVANVKGRIAEFVRVFI